MDDATPKSNNLLGNHAAGERANALIEHLQTQGNSAISLSYIDNSGINRMKGIPLVRLVSASMWGVSSIRHLFTQ